MPQQVTFATITTVLNISMLTIGYGGKVIASDLTAVLPTGTLTALVGSNGCGKSTLLRTLAGLQPSLGGEIRPAPAADKVAIVLTERIEVPSLTVQDVVAFGRIPHTGFTGRLTPKDHAAIDRAITLCAVEHLRQRPLIQLSDGERQRAMIARAIAQDTPLILLDEPTAFLDFPGKVETLRLLARIAHDEGKTILLSTHDLEIAFQLADRLWLMADGHLTEGAPAELAASGQIAALFPHVEFESATMRFRL